MLGLPFGYAILVGSWGRPGLRTFSRAAWIGPAGRIN
jgi:hypothetical protein